MVATAAYWLAEHPAIVGFRWSPTHLWFSTWAFLASTLAHAVAFGFRFWVGAAPVQHALLGCNLACHVGVVWMHFGGGAGGCSGIAAWVFNTLLNAALLWVFLHCYGKRSVYDDDDNKE